MTTRHPRSPLVFALAAGQGNLLPDGTLWSHAATLGTYVKGAEFTLDAAAFRNMIAVFTSGYPQKAPVDYEHETAGVSTQADSVPWTRRAGEIVELALVEAEADLNDAQRKQVEAERARRTRLGIKGDVEFTGLWVRWEPTPRAQTLVANREVTEMSITFHPDLPHNETGVGQGPTLLSIALTNTPFLDGMIPVAASRGGGGSPAAPGKETPSMSKPTLLTRLAAVLGRPVATDDEAGDAAEARITELTRDLAAARTQSTALTALCAELGETDPAKAIAKAATLKAQAATALSAAETARKDGIKAQVEAAIKGAETKLASTEARAYFSASLTRELEGGATIETAPTALLLKSMGAAPALTQTAAGDTGADVSADLDTRIDARAKALMSEDTALKALTAEKGFTAGYREALKRAGKELRSGAAGAEVVKP